MVARLDSLPSDDKIMNRKRLNGQLIGIRLLLESYTPLGLNTAQLNEGKIIGTVLIPVEGTTCSQLRESITEFLNVPKEFCFLNSVGWPFDSSLEDKIYIADCLTCSNIVTIQQKHAKFSRIGVKLLDGPVLGFIYLKFSYDISAIRNQIISDLCDQFESNETFEFIDNNQWPVRKKQEDKLSVWDLVVNNCITIVKKQMKRNLDDESFITSKKFKLTFSRDSIEAQSKENELTSHSIVISYVHHEATPYVRDLKKALKEIGFKNIFLDIDDINAGDDWQDVISAAVNRCSIFIPLVTNRYGETRWTNREAKLADDKEKLIIPISFLDKWPPDTLALQFLTLQFIPWKTSEEMNGGNFSGHSDTSWSKTSILRVVKEIKKLCSNTNMSTPNSPSLLDDKSPSVVNLALNLNGKQKKKVIGTEKIFIVITAHSKQQKFVEKISKMLESLGYHVWNSISLSESDEESFSPIEDSHPTSPLFENSSITSNLEPSTSKSLKSIFKGKVKKAKLVILILSEDYIKSSICRQQAFYIEQRKKSIVIKDGDFQVDSPLLHLYPEHEMIAQENWECLKYKIQEKLKFDSETSYWNSVNLMVTKLKSAINTNLAVYIICASHKLTKFLEEFCRNLGNELAKIRGLNLVTSGCRECVSDIVGRNFCEEHEIMNKGQAPKVYHIIPETSSSVHTTEGTIELLPYGKTLYFGGSPANRDDIVASAFKLCILISGGEKDARLAEKFLFNDSIVIPVKPNSCKKCLKTSMTKVPDNVNESDWKNIFNKFINTEEKARSVKRIVCAVLNI